MAAYQPAAGPSRQYSAQPFPTPAPANNTTPPPHHQQYHQYPQQLHQQHPQQAPSPASARPGGTPWHSDVATGTGTGASSTVINVGMIMPEPRVGIARGPSISSLSDETAAKRNPLVDLIDTERVYAEQLALVIRRVAAAWSRKDFPPPKLDAMFRCVEAVYRANRAFGVRLKEIGSNPSSPKALGDLLMRWIDDLEPSYGRYASTFLTGFDSFRPVMANTLLPDILSDISSVTPPTPPLERWTLDALFLLPYTRLRYYRKLYARLLKSTQEGRSDHRLLLVANQHLESLIANVEARLELDVSEDDNSPTTVVPATALSVSSGEQSREQSWANEKERLSRTSSAMDSAESYIGRVESARNSAGSVATNITQSPQRQPTLTMPSAPLSSSPPSAPPPVSDLELRIDTDRTLDLFSMQPRKCKLQMNPPSLAFIRVLRSSHDVTVHFTPSATGQTVIHRRAHLFILSDLFLVTDRMEASEKAAMAQQVAREQPGRVGEGGPMPEMWLSYPPLAGKHLSVVEGQQGNVLAVTVMRRETFVIHAESEMERDKIMKDVMECIDFATSMSRRNTSALPSPAFDDTRSPSSPVDGRPHDGTFPSLRYPSPFSSASSPTGSPRVTDVPESSTPPNPLGGNALITQMNNISLQPGETLAWPSAPPLPPKQVLPPSAPVTGAALPPRGASLRNRIAQGSVPIPQPVPLGHLPEQSLTGSRLPRSGSSHSSASSRSGPSQSHMQPLSQTSQYNNHYQSQPQGYGQQHGQETQSYAQSRIDHDLPPVPQIRTGGAHLSDSGHGTYPVNHGPPARSRSAEPLRPPDPPSARFSAFPHMSPRGIGSDGTGRGRDDDDDDSPPISPVDDEEEVTTLSGPAVISAQMKCKVFVQQGHAQWKSLGGGRLKLYVEKGRNVKQLVVEADNSAKTILVSTIILTDGVERVAKTGVAVEISDRGRRTGIIYMIQLRNETSAAGLFESLLAGSDRAVLR